MDAFATIGADYMLDCYYRLPRATHRRRNQDQRSEERARDPAIARGCTRTSLGVTRDCL
jgi:hypothetical protein